MMLLSCVGAIYYFLTFNAVFLCSLVAFGRLFICLFVLFFSRSRSLFLFFLPLFLCWLVLSTVRLFASVLCLLFPGKCKFDICPEYFFLRKYTNTFKPNWSHRHTKGWTLWRIFYLITVAISASSLQHITRGKVFNASLQAEPVHKL